MSIKMKPIGFVNTHEEKIPRSWKVSDVEGRLVVDRAYLEGIRDIKPGHRIFVIFHFHKSPEFTSAFMRIKPPVHDRKIGVFSTHSPFRPNPIGMSLLDVLDVDENVIHVKGLDMVNDTPILDIKPETCPWED